MKKLLIALGILFTLLLSFVVVLKKISGKGIIDKYFRKFYDKGLNLLYHQNDFYDLEETE